jgi:hypothetical protein
MRSTYFFLSTDALVFTGWQNRGGQVRASSSSRDGKMWRDRWYFAEPFESPQWRAQWVERMEP